MFRSWAVLVVLILIVVLVAGIWSYKIPIPKVTAKAVTIQSLGTDVALPWPSYGQSAIGAVGYGVLAATPNQKAVPTASVIKIMTALAVLKVKPLTSEQPGPSITLTKADEQIYNKYVAMDGTVVPVQAGEKISERQALEALLLPSANNMADTLAIWAFGSIQNYVVYANNMADQLNLDTLHVTSASGFPPDTASSASDLVKLGIIAIQDPIISQIVGLHTATIPLAGQISNFNPLLGHHGIIGIKTGNTDQAGGCYLFAAKHTFATGQTVTLVGVILGAPVLTMATNNSISLINTSWANFTTRTIVRKGDKLGYYDLPWGGQAVATASGNVKVWGWKGSDLSAKLNLNRVGSDEKSGAVVGEVQNGSQSVNVLLGSDISVPSRSWRLTRLFNN